MLDILASLALKKPIFGALVFWKDVLAKTLKIGFHLAQTPLWILANLVLKNLGRLKEYPFRSFFAGIHHSQDPDKLLCPGERDYEYKKTV